MSEPIVAREEEPEYPAGGPAAQPTIIVQGLTYRDVQRGIFLTFGLLLVWHLAEPLTTLLLLFLLVFILAAVLNPVVVWLQQRGVPRIVSAVVLVVGFLGALALLAWLLLPPLLDEIGKFLQNMPAKLEGVRAFVADLTARYPFLQQQIPDPERLVGNLTPHLNRLLGQVGRYTLNVAVGVGSLLLIFILVIFTLANPGPLVAGLLGATPERYRMRMDSALRRILTQLKQWAIGSLILGLIIGLATGLGLSLLSAVTGQEIPYIFLFSVIAGIGEMIPNIGPVLSAVPPVLLALTIDPLLALWVLLLFIAIQQLENNIIVPLVMGQSLNLHPVSLIFTVLVMGILFGLLGAVLAVPVCAILKVCWEEFYLLPRHTPVETLQRTAEEIVMHTAEPRRDPLLAAPAAERVERESAP